MNSQFQLSPDQLSKLMQVAGQKMGKDPQQLKQQLENGQMDDVLNGLSSNQRSQLNSFMNNPKAVEQLMSNPKVQQLIQGFLGR